MKRVEVPTEGYFERSNARLHYLDWGGEGPDLLLLPGLSHSAWIFSSFANHFTDLHRVLGLTRRDHGQSVSTDGKYDIDTLVADIRSFLDYLGIGQVTIMGHSMAGDEMTHLASEYPDRVSALVYLDAAHDRSTFEEIRENSPLVQAMKQDPPEEAWESVEEYLSYAKARNPGVVDRWDVWEKELLEEVDTLDDGTLKHRFPGEAFLNANKKFKPQFDKVRCPALNIAAISDEPGYLPSTLTEDERVEAIEYFREVIVPWQKEQARNFSENVEQGQLIIEEGHHLIFLDKEEEIVPKIRDFLREIHQENA